MTCFVILHYIVLDETLKCVETLINDVKGEKKIIIVDNCSPNQSGEQLKNIFQNSNQVVVLLNNENSGFARGNNVGYRYAKEKFNPDFIVVMNNDVELKQSDFIQKIENIFDSEQFYVLSPDIFSTSANIHQSPKQLSSISYSELVRIHKRYKNKSKSNFIVPLRCFLKQFDFLKLLYYKKRNETMKIDYTKKYYNVPLHGSCFIFSKLFSDIRENAFFEKTFFYYESEILDYECNRDGMKTLYDPSIQVLHHQNVSTNVAISSIVKRARFANKCIYESTGVFLEMMREDTERKGKNE